MWNAPSSDVVSVAIVISSVRIGPASWSSWRRRGVTQVLVGQAVDQSGEGRKPNVQLSANLTCRHRAHAHRQKHDFSLLDRQIEIQPVAHAI